jgi:hypothetical protein
VQDLNVESSETIAERIRHLEERTRGRDADPELTSDHGLGMVASTREPALRREAVMPSAVQRRGPIRAHGVRREAQAKRAHQIGGEPPLAPRRVVPGPAPAQRSPFGRHRCTSVTGVPVPEQPSPVAIPTRQRLEVHHSQGLSPIEPASAPDQGAPWLDVSCAREGELGARQPVFRREGSGGRRQWSRAHTPS